MSGPPNGLETCPIEYQNCTIDREIDPSRWNRIRLGIFQFDRGPPFTEELVNYWKKKNHFVGSIGDYSNITRNWELRGA